MRYCTVEIVVSLWNRQVSTCTCAPPPPSPTSIQRKVAGQRSDRAHSCNCPRDGAQCTEDISSQKVAVKFNGAWNERIIVFCKHLTVMNGAYRTSLTDVSAWKP